MKHLCYFMLAKTTMCDNRLCMKAFAIQKRQRSKPEIFDKISDQDKIQCLLPQVTWTLPQFLPGFYGKLGARQTGMCKRATFTEEYVYNTLSTCQASIFKFHFLERTNCKSRTSVKKLWN